MERGNESDSEYEFEELEDGSDTVVDEGWYEGMEEEMSDSEVEEEGEIMEDGPLVTLSDSDVLDCPICMEPLRIPVYQCDSGHVACSSCCLKVHNICPSCSLKIGHNRCRVLEKVLESATAPCKNKKYGCEEKLKYCNNHEHEEMCAHSPCHCPVTSCNYKGSMPGLYSHFCCSHIFSTQIFSYNKYNPITLEKSHKHLIFCGEDNGIFVLNKFSEVNGSAINVIRIAPPHCDKRAYEIKVRYEESTISLRSALENIPKKWEHRHPERNFLHVPEYCTTPEGHLHLELHIQPAIHLQLEQLRIQESPVSHPQVMVQTSQEEPGSSAIHQ